jgi:hypothetical protein
MNGSQAASRISSTVLPKRISVAPSKRLWITATLPSWE